MLSEKKLRQLMQIYKEERNELFAKGCRPAFGSPGGKRYLAKTIVSYIPEHKTYVEPFIGGGAVFFAKEPSEVEVINDLDKEITFAYRFMKKISDEDLKKLKKKNWVGSKSHFENLKKNKPENDLERFYRFQYIMRFSRFKNYVGSFEGQESDCTSALPNIRERLKNVKIENNDYKESINYDSKETFYYLDPPYPDTENKTIGGNISLIELHDFCKKIKGKFILSLNDVLVINETFKDFYIKKVKVLQSFSNTEGTQEFRKELLISNFPLKKGNIYLSKSDKVLIEGLPSFVWIPEFINIAGSLFYEREHDRKPNDIDIIVRAKEEDGKFTITLDKSLRLKIDRILEKRVGRISGNWLSPEWLGSTFGPNWRYQTGWDLVLVPHQPQEIREMNESQFASEFYKKENYEEFCDFGGGHFSKFVKEHPEFESEEFREYVIVHNKADRDSGELEDIVAPEVLRLAREFAQEENIQIEKSRHSREKCMECDKPPLYECLWAEGIAHAWFCKKHFKEWATTGDGKGEIISVKEVKDGIAAKKFGDNRNPNIWAELKAEFAKEFYKKLSDKQKKEYEEETAVINENKKKPQAKEVHKFKAARYTHPNGHPRCLICGDEEPIGGVCNMPDSWYQKHEFDDEEAWKEERKILREKRIIKQGADRINSPTFAYQAVYNELPPTPLRGRTDSPKRMWNGLEIDEHLKDSWMKELNSIPEIEIRASDEGKSEERVAFIVFRMKDPKDDCKVQAVSNKLNEMEGLYSKYDTGQEGRLRIVVAGKIKLGDKDWEEWWNSLAGKIKGVVKEELEKLDLKEFRQTGIDYDLKNPAKRWRELLADLRYLFNSGYPKLKKGEKWGEWDLTTLLKYGAKIIDTLRTKCYFTLIPPKIGEEKYGSSYWQAYREARDKKYMKTKPPADKKEEAEWDEKRKEIIKSEWKGIAKFRFKKIDAAEHIVGGVVYFSNKEDSQEDWARPPEVWKALKNFMLKKKTIKVMHKGIKRDVPIVEVYFVEEKHHKGGANPENLLEKGDWWLAVYLGDKENKDIWERVLKKELTGFSMAGKASSFS